ncbi:MAG: DUF3782 domain-containing protein [Sulfolobales archaeon]
MEDLEKALEKILEKRLDLLEAVLIKHPEVIYNAIVKITPWNILATKEDLKKLEERIGKVEEGIKAIEGRIEKLEGRVKRVEEEMATKNDLRRLSMRLENMVSALGARWGVINEEAYRAGLKEILQDMGWNVIHEVITDTEGHVYGRAEEVEIDIVISDGKIYLVEITSAVKRADLDVVRRKAELYERLKGVKLDKVIIISPFIHDKNPERIAAIARNLGIEIIYPRPSEAIE